MNRYAGMTRDELMRQMEEQDRARYDAQHGAGAYDKAEERRLTEGKRWHEILERCRQADAERRHAQAVKIAQAYAAQGTAPDACVLAALRG